MIVSTVGMIWFHCIFRLDKVTAYFGAMPGGLQEMVMFGKESGGDARALSLIHATRILLIVTLVPLVLTQYYQLSLDHPTGQPLTQTPLVEMILMIIAAVGGWQAAKAIGMYGSQILGPMIAATLLSMSDLLHVRPPEEAILVAQFFIGTSIGVYYVGITLNELRQFMLAGIGYAVLICILAIVYIQYFVPLDSHSNADLFLAFMPGGQAELTVMTIVAGADLGFVISHHLFRMILVIIGAPLLIKLWSVWNKP